MIRQQLYRPLLCILLAVIDKASGCVLCYSARAGTTTATKISAAFAQNSYHDVFVNKQFYGTIVKRTVEKNPVTTAICIVLANHLQRHIISSRLTSSSSEDSTSDGNSKDKEHKVDKNDTQEQQQEDKDANPMSVAMVSSIKVYKEFISPLLPPACRFLPTCSQYGVQAIERFGPTKGAILTAWRLMRCTPLGGKGYDPPRWPPVAYTYGSY